MIRRIILLAMLFPFAASAQDTLYMGSGKKAIYTPPSSFTGKSGGNGEYRYWTSGSEFYITIGTKWKDGRTAKQILEQGLKGLQTEACEDKSHTTEVSTAVWKICRVAVGPRKEGRLWMVITFEGVRNAIDIGVHFQEVNEARMEEVRKSIDGIRFVE